jgi:hypothetical protein
MAAWRAKHDVAAFDALATATPERARPGREMGDVMIAMPDGVRLATDVYLPEGGGPFPTILTRLPYGKREPYCFMPVIARHFVRKGYAYVVQDVRGKWGSEGVFEPNMAANEIGDGSATIDWIARQPWSTGRVGMWGESYFGFTSWAGAVGGHPALAAIAPGDITVDRYRGTFRDGCLQLNTVGLWAIRMMARRYQDVSAIDLWHLPLAELGNAAGIRSSYFDAVIANPRPSPFWEERSLLQAFDRVRIPVLHWGGWYDNYLGPLIADWRRLRDRNAPADHNHLFIGPWDHEGTADKLHRAGLLPVDPGIQARRWDTFQAFFDRYLMGLDNGFGAGGAVRYYTLGADRWREASAWPPAGTRIEPWFLHSGGRAATLSGDGVLSPDPPGEEPPDSYDYDPRDPVAWTLDVDCWSIAGQMGDRAPIEARPDVLVYTGRPLEKDIEITGPIGARLHLASSALDTDVMLALCDVFPDGRVNLIQDGVLRASHRSRDRYPLPLVPGEATALGIDLWSTSYRVPAGHRLRLEVTSSDFNRYDRNPNTGAAYGREAHPVVARQTVYHDPLRPSHVALPIAPD